MPGMSPRIKAKKGRFGADGLPPTINILSHKNGDAEALTISFNITASANDPENGDLSSAITWTANRVGGSGSVTIIPNTGATATITFDTGAGDWDVTATIVDGGFTITDTVSLTVA